MTVDGESRHWRADLGLSFVCLIWGATFVLVKQALADIPTLLFLTLRFSMAAAALALMFTRPLRRAARRGPAIRGGVVAGIFLFCGYTLQTFGLKFTTASKAGFLTGLYIPLVPLLSAAIHRRAPHLAEIGGIAVAAAGMAMMTLERGALAIGAGDLLVIGCAVAFALHILALGHFARAVDTATLAVTQIGVCALLGAASFWWAEPVRVRWSREVWIALAVTSLLATALAFAVQTWAQQFSSPTRTALIFTLEPVFAWLTSWWLVGDTLTGRKLAGAALILAGILFVELKPFGLRGHPLD